MNNSGFSAEPAASSKTPTPAAAAPQVPAAQQPPSFYATLAQPSRPPAPFISRAPQAQFMPPALPVASRQPQVVYSEAGERDFQTWLDQNGHTPKICACVAQLMGLPEGAIARVERAWVSSRQGFISGGNSPQRVSFFRFTITCQIPSSYALVGELEKYRQAYGLLVHGPYPFDPPHENTEVAIIKVHGDNNRFEAFMNERSPMWRELRVAYELEKTQRQAPALGAFRVN